MTPEKEEELIDSKSDEVPTIDPDDEHCRAKRTQKDDEGVNRFIGYCRNPAGKGTDHPGDGRCKYHGGCSPGAPSGHQYASKHSLDADPHHHYRSLDPEEEEFIRGVATSIENRLRAQGEDLDHLDRVLARRISVELHIVSRATGYIREEGLVREVKGNNRNQALLDEVRRRDKAIVEMLDELGVLDGDDDVAIWKELLEVE